MRKKRFPLPKPAAVKFTYCKLPIEGAPKSSRIERLFYDCGYCAGCNERHIGVKTASVAGFPFLCENCYRMVFQYSQHIEDPYRIKHMWEDDEVSVETTRKVIASAKRLDFIDQTMRNALIYKVVSDNEEYDDADTGYDQRAYSEEDRRKLKTLWASIAGLLEVDRKNAKEAEAKGDTKGAQELWARVKDSEEKLQKIDTMLGDDQGSRISELTTTCGWTEQKELMHYRKVLPAVDERDFDFDICDLTAFTDYLKKITITVDAAYQNDRIRALKHYFSKNPLVDVTCEAAKTKDGLTQIRLVHRAETIDGAHEKFRRIILKYRSVLPYLSDASGMVYDAQKTVIVVLRQYRVQEYKEVAYDT